MRRWGELARVDRGEKEGLSSDERAEIARLRREVRILAEEREILKKAAVGSARHGNTSVLMSQSRGLGWHEHDGCTRPRSAGNCGSHVWIRHGTADVFTVAEVLARDEYSIPDAARVLLPDRPRVLDFGANIGVFGIRAIRDLSPATITSVEADPFNADVLRRNAANVPIGSEWRVIQAFAAPEGDGQVTFAGGQFAESRAGVDGGHSVPTVDALALMDGADLVKMDIEGAEWPILEDPRFAAVSAKVLALEYHRWGCDHGEDPSTRCRDLLHAAGFEWRDSGAPGDDFGMLWAWRRV